MSTTPVAIAEHAKSGSKFSDSEVTGELAGYALTWLGEYTGSFGFLLELKAKLDDAGSLSVPQTRGVLNCILAETKTSDPSAVVGDVPAGRYALPSLDDGHLVFWQVDRPTEGKWAGWVFVKQLIGAPGDWQEQKATKSMRHSVLARILEANPTKAAAAFGHATRTCGYCGSPLSNTRSRAAGFGETCADNNGLYYPSQQEALVILNELGGAQEELFAS